jgi:integrase
MAMWGIDDDPTPTHVDELPATSQIRSCAAPGISLMAKRRSHTTANRRAGARRGRWRGTTEPCSALGDYAPIMGAMFTFAAYTLMRPAELVALDWADVHLDAGAHRRVRVSRRLYRGKTDLPKSNRERTVTITAPARQALDTLLELRGYTPAGLVFPSKRGSQISAPTLTGYWQQVCARARLDVEFYMATKHYGVHHMKVVLGLPDAAIAAQAGWSERAVTKMVQTYAHAVDDRRLDEIDAAFDRGQRDTVSDAEPA